MFYQYEDQSRQSYEPRIDRSMWKGSPARGAEDDPGTARSKQTTSKRKKVKRNDCNKKRKEVKRV